MKPPVFVMGVPRSGTQMLSRCLGRASGCLLVSEHRNKDLPPEQGDARNDHLNWQEAFGGFEAEDVPYDHAAYERLKALWAAEAGGRRLILKNPQNVVRAAAMRRAFPDAPFVWLTRDPWAVIQSMIAGKRGRAMTLRSRAILDMPDDLVLRSAASWVEGVKAMRATPGIEVRYEAVVAKPREELQRLYDALELTGLEENSAADMPKARKTDYTLVRYVLRRTPFREQVLDMIRPVAAEFGYPQYPPGTPGDTHLYSGKAFAAWFREPKKKPPYGFPRLEKARGMLRGKLR